MKKTFAVLLIFSIILPLSGAENSTAYYRKGAELFKTGNYNEAEKNFKRAVEINPSYTLGHYGLGRIYLITEGKSEDAIRHLKLSVMMDKSFARGWFKLGLAELISGRYIDALHSFNEAYEKDRTFIEALYNMGVIYDLLGDSYKAFHYYRLYYRKTSGEKDDFLN